MAANELRSRIQRVAPATSGRLTASEFLLSGAAAGLVGWGGTQAVAWSDHATGALLVTVLWAVLIGGFVGLTVLHAPDSIRFSDAMFAWGAVNSTAMALTVAGLFSVVPGQLAFWHAWVGATAVGYCWTGGVLEGAGQPVRGRGYLGAGVVGLGLLAIGAVAFPLVSSAGYLALAALHALPMLLDVRTALPAAHRTSVVGVAVAAVLVAGVVVA
ncbi:hypothetical protein BVU17_10780 [Haloarcula taiwanensis]|uniref:Uncharacterized protein n=1 Tax=Haloarcula taiwanensis TaxID=1932004 RepID=A0A2H4ZZS3_9EURY|nr:MULTISPECIES: hypothetical protein [Haloarcula]AUG47978.1 hypothetical protein BVU17_10780 [Haloarcula taiwanensis]RLM39334.1 hypothetical protein DVK01_01890 [Haloarcula sp. Atlit-120R]RLM47233.1 hypothetical protein DVK00_01635 [Haloarcula sp. Atlit-47R]RLM97496.1 hypothetical protein D3D01_06765 [Haloarcula sp. Atlit-7R]